MHDIYLNASQEKIKKLVISVSDHKDPFLPAQTVFKAKEISGLNELIKTILTSAWSPIIFKDGYRRSTNFLGADLLAADVDGTLPLKEAHQILLDLNLFAIVTTTKSHGVNDKERYRVILKSKNHIDNYELYQSTMSEVASLFRGDRSVKDAARFFFPSKSLVFFQSGISILPKMPIRDKIIKSPQEPQIPSFVLNFLRTGISNSGYSRHETIINCCFYLFRAGWALEKVTSAFYSIDFSQGPRNILRQEIDKAILWSFNKFNERD